MRVLLHKPGNYRVDDYIEENKEGMDKLFAEGYRVVADVEYRSVGPVKYEEGKRILRAEGSERVYPDKVIVYRGVKHRVIDADHLPHFEKNGFKYHGDAKDDAPLGRVESLFKVSLR